MPPQVFKAESEQHSGHESDTSSEVSNGEDLIFDLENALKDNFTFKGSFAYASNVPNAPNPCLVIQGAGLIGLPLSTRDAKSIVECSSQAPYGHGTETLINKDVRNTWEIEPAKISFQNKAWEPFVQKLAAQTVCTALGVHATQVVARCELYKLLLYEPGSHTQKAEGMFATMIVVLPSHYTGGQVHVSHGSQSRIFDFSQHSLTSAAVLAWYTDVFHEVKQVESGYRLALAYNLIHMSSGVPRPMLPAMEVAVGQLYKVLQKWKKNLYEKKPKNFVAYLLDHRYSEHELLCGMRSLKGVDAHKISHLQPIAEQLGYTVCLGNLVHCESGYADDHGPGCWKRCKYGYDYEPYNELSDPGMAEVESITTTISCVVDLDGARLLENDISVNDDGDGDSDGDGDDNDDLFIPRDPFEHAAPDDKGYEGYMGNGAGTLQQWYHRTVLILIRNEDALAFFCSRRAGGFKYGLQRLQKANNAVATKDDIEIAKAMAVNLDSNSLGNAEILLKYALKWNNPSLWVSVMQAVGDRFFQCSAQQYFEAWNQFTFDQIDLGFSATLLRISVLRSRCDFLDAIRAYASKNNKIVDSEWYRTQLVQALGTYKVTEKTYAEDVRMLIGVAQNWGLPLVHEHVIKAFRLKPILFEFWVELVKGLVAAKACLCGDPHTRADQGSLNLLCTPAEFEDVLTNCFSAVIPLWNNATTWENNFFSSYSLFAQTNINNQPDTAKVERIIQILELCVMTNHLGTSLTLFQAMLADRNDLSVRFNRVFIPFIPKLLQFLRGRNLSIRSPPFDSFVRELIGTYLHFILLSKTGPSLPVPKVGCGCVDCDALDRFMASPDQKETTFTMVQNRRTHLEKRLSEAYCSWTTLRSGSPHSLQIIKCEDFFASLHWDSRKAAALKFLGLFGNNEQLQALMGARWNDVIDACKGVRPFSLQPEPEHGRNVVPGPLQTSVALLKWNSTTCSSCRARETETTRIKRCSKSLITLLDDN